MIFQDLVEKNLSASTATSQGQLCHKLNQHLNQTLYHSKTCNRRLVEKDTLTQLINPAKLEALLEAACLNLTSDLPRPKRLISCKNYFYFLIFNV